MVATGDLAEMVVAQEEAGEGWEAPEETAGRASRGCIF